MTVDLAGNLGEIKLEGQATIDSLLEPRRPTLRLTVSGPSVEYLTEKLQVEQITSGPLNLVASITPLGDDMQRDATTYVGVSCRVGSLGQAGSRSGGDRSSPKLPLPGICGLVIPVSKAVERRGAGPAAPPRRGPAVVASR